MNITQAVLRKLPATPSRKILLKTRSPISTTFLCRKSTKEPTLPSSSSSSSSDSDDDIKNKKAPNVDAITKLNSLLQQMTSEDYSKTKGPAIQLAQPTNKRVKGRKEKEFVTSQSIEKQVVKAVKGVAESFGGNTKQTESELLMKLLNPSEATSETGANLSDILKGMKIERDEKPQQSKAEQVRSVLQRVSSQSRYSERPADQQRPRQSMMPVRDQVQAEPVELFTGQSLGIFTDPSQLNESPQLPTWQKLQDKELKLAVTHPPSNYFQEMILWTEQGKFWQFPINNEFGLEEESKVYFTEHVFLEEHLEPWCPPQGPLRHFMELVCVGLSKNSYLTVQAKKEHIEWFKNYFEEKRRLLEEVGAFPVGSNKEKKPSNSDVQ